MKTQYMVTLAVIAGFGLGAVTVQGLHAQAKPPVYYIAEIDVTNLDAYVKEYAPLAQAGIKKAGGRLLAAGEKGHCARRATADTARCRAGLGQRGENSSLAQFSGV
jgi:uncharacterized protein DUF1330